MLPDTHLELVELLAVALGMLGFVLTLCDTARTRASAYRWMATFALLALASLYASAVAHADRPHDVASGHALPQPRS